MAKTIQDLIDDMKRHEAELKKLVQDAPRIAGIESVNYARDAIKNGGLEGEKWPDRLEGTPRNDRPLLVNIHTLSDSIRYEVSGVTVTIGVDGSKVPYAQIHNEGGDIQVTPQMRKFFWARFMETGDDFFKHLALTKKSHFHIPKRTYLKFTPELHARITKNLESRLKQIFNS
jgi:phage gpG-like protein